MTDEVSLRDRLTEAGNKFDGHVTNGSIEEQLKIVREIVVEMCAEYRNTVLEEAYLIARGGDGRFEKQGARQLYWLGRSAAADEIRKAKTK